MTKNLVLEFRLLLVAVYVLSSCQKSINEVYFTSQENFINAKNPVVLFIDDGNYESMHYKKHFHKICDYTKFSFLEKKMTTWNTNSKIPESVQVLIIHDTQKLEDKTIAVIDQFVTNGGSLLLLKNSNDKRFAYFIGLKPEASYKIDTSAKGIKFTTPILPNLQNKKFKEKSLHKGLDQTNFDAQVTMLATSITNNEYPLITANKIKNGNVILYNSEETLEKRDRGLLFSMLLKGLEGMPYPVVSTSTIFIDDFPSPLYDSKNEPIESEFNISNRDFVTKIWWPDMLQLSSEFSINYTALVAFEYSENITPPFSFQQWDLHEKTPDFRGSNWMAREVLKKGHELGLHGYNHVSLLVKDWGNPDYMTMALEAAKKKWKITPLKGFPTSYVPPSNFIDSIGLDKLTKTLPSLKYMCSLYLGNYAEGNGREYDIDKLNNHLFDYPRISSGYIINNEKEYNIQSLYLFTGIWSHFLHPDDVYQIKSEKNSSSGHFEYRNKNNLYWKKSRNGTSGMFYYFRNYLAEFQSLFPLNKFLNANDASIKVRYWRNSLYNRFSENGRTVVQQLQANPDSKNNTYWFMYASAANSKKIEASLTQQQIEYHKTVYMDGYLYTVKTKKNRIAVAKLDPQNKTIKTNAIHSYADYYAERKKRIDIRLVLQEYIENDNIEGAIAYLKKKIDESPTIAPEIWDAYIKYSAWENRTINIWDLIDSHYEKYPLPENLLYAQKLSQRIGHRNKESAEAWLLREIELFPNNPTLLKKYCKAYSSVENKSRILTFLEKLVVLEPSAVNYQEYVKHLFWFSPTSVPQQLDQITPCAYKLNNYAHDIAWSYAKENKYAKALQWSECTTTINEETQLEWMIKANKISLLKKRSFPTYIQYLLTKDTTLLKKELNTITPCASKELQPLADDITWFYATNKKHKKALAWTDCSKNIDISSKLYWLFLLGDFDSMHTEFSVYTAQHPKDATAIATMVGLLHSKGDFVDAWILTSTLPNSPKKDDLKHMLNNDVQYIDIKLQKQLLEKHDALFYPEVKRALLKKIRIAEGNIITANANIETNNENITFFSKNIGYGFYNKKKNRHTFLGTQTSVYPLDINIEKADNTERHLAGITYKYGHNNSKKYNYQGWTGAESDRTGTLFFQTGAAIQSKGIYNYFGAQIAIFPVRTSPGYSQKIYQSQLNIYKEFYFKKRFQTILSTEANYYTDNQFFGTLITKNTLLPRNKNLKHTWLPFIEGSVLKGTINRDYGYPYWMINERINAGLGLGYNFGRELDKFTFSLESSLFIDSFSGLFSRHTGKLAYTIFHYTVLTVNFEIFADDNFFSNTYQIGIKYYLR